MDRFSITTATTTNASTLRFSIPFPHKQLRKFGVFAAKDDNKLGNWDQMEHSKLNPEQDKGKRPKDLLAKAPNTTKHSIPNVVLWKAATLEEDDVGAKLSSRLSFKPNLSLKMGKEEGKERFSDLILVRNPEPLIKINDEESTINIEESTCQTEKDVFVLQELGNAEDQASGDHSRSRSELYDTDNSSRNLDLTFEMENVAVINLDPSQENEEFSNLQEDGGHENDLLTGSQPSEHRDIVLDQPAKEVSNIGERITRIENLIPNSYYTSENFPSIPHLKDREDTDWKRAEDLIKTTGREEASFGSLIGFLPYRNLATKWKFLAFESWLRMKGLDPATYRKNLGIIGSYDAKSKTTSPNPTVDREKIEEELSPNMKLEDLLAIYDQEKLQYLSTFVGQPKEKEESIERKRSLMIERVPALIHQTEVSWDATLNPTSSFKIGQVVEAKPDPLTEALEAVLDDHAVLDGTSEADQPENEWDDLELLVEELQQYEGIDLVTKGRFFLSPCLTPTFQVTSFFQENSLQVIFIAFARRVYMASMFKNQYKLLARAGNKVQE
ncbi:hypothetical protein Ccrd_002509, partial [Cynara cardunculus var. scolymus]